MRALSTERLAAALSKLRERQELQAAEEERAPPSCFRPRPALVLSYELNIALASLTLHVNGDQSDECLLSSISPGQIDIQFSFSACI
jgi:hypothetical protein